MKLHGTLEHFQMQKCSRDIPPYTYFKKEAGRDNEGKRELGRVGAEEKEGMEKGRVGCG